MLNNWRNIHSEFANELQQRWEAEGFVYEETRSWINIGLKPTDYKLASYIRHELGYKPEEVLNFADLPTLRTIYQESLNEHLADLQIQPTIHGPEIIKDEHPVPEITPEKPTLQEELDLTEALMLSLGLEDGDGDDSPPSSSSEEEEEIDWKELEPYLSEKRLDLKKYFVFSLGKEVKVEPKVSVADEFGMFAPVYVPNLHLVEPLLSEHLTQLFQDGNEKKIISFTGRNVNQPSSEWRGDRLDQKIRNGEEVYVVFDKSKAKDNPSYIKGKADSINPYLGELEGCRIIVLAMEAKPQVRVFQSKKNALKFLKNNDPILSGKRNLYEWWKEEKKFADNQKENLERIGIDSKKDSLDGYKSEELIRMLKYEDIAKQNKDKLPFEEGEIKKMIFLSPPRFQDKDCAVIVSQGRTAFPLPAVGPLFPLPLLLVPIEDFGVFLLVYEEPWKNIGSYLYVKKVKSYSKIEEAEEEADRLVEKLMDRKNNSYPACAVFDKVGEVFDESIFNPVRDIEGVKGFVSPWNVVRTNPDGYFKPFDIVRVENPFYSHVGVYLGKDSKGKHKAAQVSKELNGLYITDWEELFGDNSCDLSRHHPFITYKKTRLIRKHIARAYASKWYNGTYALLFGTDNYEKGNCQHFANRAVLGLNISNEGTLFKKDKFLIEEINRTTRHFNNLNIIGNNRKFHHVIRKGIRGFANRADDQNRKVKLVKTGEGKYTARIIHNPPWSWKQPVELRPSDNCKIQ